MQFAGFRSVIGTMWAVDPPHPCCVGQGEIGLDYHYDNSPSDIQQRVFVRQLCEAVKLRKPLTIHTREAEEDTERILKRHVPADHKASSLMPPTSTPALVCHMAGTTGPAGPRILLETDAPFMVPSNLYGSLPGSSGDCRSVIPR
ncbi:hypothetical protein J3R82DRAFT_7544 [Butyriboletus roseoflavus]|nr:hypothetical protein J3R82DRAFT_7544 [Butyriboletus roseoflavus]